MNIRVLIYLISFFAVLPSAVLADDTLPDFSDLAFDDLMQVEVTSVSKKSEKLSQAAAAIYVVTADQIRRTGATSIPEALRLVPGVDAVQVDPNRWAVSIRGFNGLFANKLLVLIDGRSVYSPVFSGVYWEHFDYLMEDIERIEVIRGPGATLWGTNAVNGVINIITREAGDNPGGSLSIAAGNEYQGISLRQDGEVADNIQMRAFVKGKRLDQSEDLYGDGQDNGGDYLQTGARIDIQANTNQWVSMQGELFRSDFGQQLTVPLFTAPYQEVVNDDVDAKGGSFGLHWGKLTGLDSEVSFRLGYDFYDHQEIKYTDQGYNIDVEFQHLFSPVKNSDLVWGIGYKQSNNDFNSSLYVGIEDESSTTEIWNLFAQNTLHFTEQNIALTLGAKVEHNSYSGSEFQPNIRASWVPNEQLTWWAAISRAMRSPSRADVEGIVNVRIDTSEYPALIKVLGKEDFLSEQSDAYEIGARWMPIPILSFDLAVFYNDYEDLRSSMVGELDYSYFPDYLIQLVDLDNNIKGYSAGGELLATWQATPDWRFRFVYNHLNVNVKDTVEPNSDLVALFEGRVPEHQLSLWSSIDLRDNLEFDFRLFYITDREWYEEKVDAKLDADLRLGWQVNPSLALSLVGRNLFHSAEQEFFTESWGASSAIERSVFIKGTVTW